MYRQPDLSLQTDYSSDRLSLVPDTKLDVIREAMIFQLDAIKGKKSINGIKDTHFKFLIGLGLKAGRQVLTYGSFSSFRRTLPCLDGGRDLKSKTETIFFLPLAV